MSDSGYYGDGGRLDGVPDDVLIRTAYTHDCNDAALLMDGLHKADLAHTLMLIEQGVIPEAPGKHLLEGLLELQSIPASVFPVDPKYGDVYNSKDIALKAAIGETSGWLHVGRPRREAVNIAYLIAVRKRVFRVAEVMSQFAHSLLNLAERNKDVVGPDFTYLLHAHPTRLGHYLTTFAFSLLRDMDRMMETYKRFNRSPAGSGSVNGSSLPIDRERLAELLGFDGVIPHSRDGMWQVDLPMEMLSSLSMMMTNLNRLADELQIWNTAEFGTVDLPDTLCRASVIMPQKKNPYPLAYVRGVTSWLTGQLAGFSAHGKGPSGNPDSRIFIYGDLPEAMDRVTGALELFAEVLDGISFREDVLKARVSDGFAFATDLADYLTYERRIDYRTAHQISGRLVKIMLEGGVTGADVSADLINQAAIAVQGEPIDAPEDLVALLKDPMAIAKSRRTIGGAGDEPLEAIFTEIKERVAAFDSWRRENIRPDAFGTLDRAVVERVFPKGNFLDLVAASTKANPDKPAIIEGKDRVFTYAQLFAQARKLSETLGDQSGNRVALKITDKPNLIAAIMAVHLSSGTVVSLDVDDEATLTQMLTDCDPAIVLFETGALAEETVSSLKKTFKKTVWKQAAAIDEIGAVKAKGLNLKVPKTAPDAIAHLFYTSGTTGHRKGVVIDHAAYVVPGHSLNRAMGYDDGVTEYVVGNLSHAFPFGRVRALLFVGGTAVVDNGAAMPQRVLAGIEANDCNAIGAPASVVKMLIQRFELQFSALSDQLKWIKVGTQAVPQDTKSLLISTFPNTNIVQQYGASETPRTVFNDLKLASNHITTGQGLPGYIVSIRDADDMPVMLPGRTGRVWLSGPHIASGYWRNEAKTGASFEQGWYKTDDMGSLDEDGQLTLYGRIDEIINFGGQKLAPADIEGVMEPLMHGKRFIVFGVPDPAGLLGEVPAIVIEDGETESLEPHPDWRQDRIAVVKALGKQASFIPKLGYRIAQIPMTKSGKPKRKVLSALSQTVAAD